MTPDELTSWLKKLAKEIKATASDYPKNKVNGCPIPFFGEILNARVVTIGVNPSSTEFESARNWETAVKVADWQDRMSNYFRQPGITPHNWFDTWSICLELLGISYVSGTAAHLDVSPRPTVAMLNNPRIDHQEFRSMVEHDVGFFFELLAQLPQVQLLLVAGPIPQLNGKKQQLAEFIGQHARAYDAQWNETEPMPKLIDASHPNGIPVFICPYEKGIDGRYAMVRQVYRTRGILREIISA